MSGTTSFYMQQSLDRLQAGDPRAREDLICYARRRLHLLARRMFANFPRLHQLEELDDVFQEGMLRLWRALDQVKPATTVDLMCLAAVQLRRSLRDLARKHFGRSSNLKEGQSNRQVISSSGVLNFPIDDPTNSPDSLVSWTEIHAAVDRLPITERTVFDLLFYHGLSRSEAAALLAVSVRQINRRWLSARSMLSRMMDGSWPDL